MLIVRGDVIITFIYNILKSSILYILASFILGGVLGSILIKHKKFVEVLKKMWNRSPVEFIVGFITLIIFLFGLLGSVFQIQLAQNAIVNSLSFFSSVILSWILTNYSNEKAFNEKQRDAGIRSYRHSIKIKNKIDYGIAVSNLINDDLIYCNCSSGGCELAHNVLRLRDSLITAQMDASGNINDWADVFSEQIYNFGKIKDAEKEKRRLLEKLQEYNPYDMTNRIYVDDINGKIQEQDIIINDKIKDISANVLITLRAEDSFKEEYLIHINKEADYKRAMRLQRDVNTNRFRSRSQYNSGRNSPSSTSSLDQSEQRNEGQPNV